MYWVLMLLLLVLLVLEREARQKSSGS